MKELVRSMPWLARPSSAGFAQAVFGRRKEEKVKWKEARCRTALTPDALEISDHHRRRGVIVVGPDVSPTELLKCMLILASTAVLAFLRDYSGVRRWSGNPWQLQTHTLSVLTTIDPLSVM